MIVVTFKGSPSPLVGRVKGITVGSHVLGPSACAALVDALQRFTIPTHGFLFVAPGARIHSARVWLIENRKDFDVAAHVGQIGSPPKRPGRFSGVGRVSTEALYFRPTVGARRVLDRWADQNAVAPGRESINLAIALAELPDVAFLHLPSTWVWRESTMRALAPSAEPVVEMEAEAVVAQPEPVVPKVAPVPSGKAHLDEDPRKPVLVRRAPELPVATPKPVPVPTPRQPRQAHRARGPEVLWNGHLYSYASYGKINRETLLRVANSVSVRIDSSSVEQSLVDEYTRSRLDPYKATLVGPRAPFLRFFGPDFRPETGRHRINWTLMETHGRVHADMAAKVNESYDELWVCTDWNAETFRSGGVKVPISVVRLGVDRAIYKPQRRRRLPPCRLLSTGRRGTIAVPSGFTFLSVGLPSARKGFEAAADALALAFGPRADVDLVIATTHGATSLTSPLASHVARSRVRVWVLEGRFNEHEMAGIYAATDAYVSASIGEGWNLPAHEAAACGRPVVLPRNSVHPEIFGENAFLFETDGVGRIPSVEVVSPWYVGMKFSIVKDSARKSLAAAMQAVRDGGPRVRQRVRLLDARLAPLTWDATAANVTERLLRVQP